MPTHKQLKVTVPNSSRGNGRSDTITLQKAFPGSPIYKGELTEETLDKKGQELLVDGIVNDGGHTFGEFDRDYSDSPDLASVATGGGGLPGSPYAPNIASPGEDMNPTNIPAEGAEATELAKGSGGFGLGNGLESPQKTTKVISSQKLGSLKFGKSEGN